MRVNPNVRPRIPLVRGHGLHFASHINGTLKGISCDGHREAATRRRRSNTHLWRGRWHEVNRTSRLELRSATFLLDQGSNGTLKQGSQLRRVPGHANYCISIGSRLLHWCPGHQDSSCIRAGDHLQCNKRELVTGSPLIGWQLLPAQRHEMSNSRGSRE